MSTRTSLIAVSLFTLATVAASGCVVVSDEEGDSASSDSAGGTDGGSDSNGGTESDSGGSDSDAGTTSDSGGSDSDPSEGSSTDPTDGSDSDPSTGSDSGADSTGGDPTGGSGDEPETGLWEYDATSFEDGCNLGAYGYGWGGYLLTNNGNGTFTVETQSGETFDCDLLGGGEFFCPDRAGEEPDTMGADATVSVTLVASGTFDTSQSGSGVQTAEATCEGPDCPLIEQTLGISFPCMIVEEFDTNWLSP